MMRVRQASGWSLAIGFATVLAIGCGDNIPPDGTQLPKVTFECRGTVSDGMGNTILLNAANTPPVNVCLGQNATDTAKAQECQKACNAAKAQYADSINSMNGTMVTTAQLTCTIGQTPQIADDCTEKMQSGLSADLPLNGGPSTYVANLTGNLNFSVTVDTPIGSVTTDANTATSGQLAYTIIPLDRNCPSEGGCQLLVSALKVSAADFTISRSVLGVTLFEHHITNLRMQNNGWVQGAWFPDGHFEIPANEGLIAINLSDNGTHNSIARPNLTPITGTIDPVTGAVVFDPFSQGEGSTTITLTSFSGSNVVTPPHAVITAPAATVECNRTNAAATTLDGSGSTSPSSPIFSYAWSVNGGPTITGAVVPATLNLGANNVALNVFNQSMGVDATSKVVTVVDTTPPTFGPLTPVTSSVCDPSSQGAAIATPTATDVCSPTVTVTGAVIASNGATLATPIPIQNGKVTVPAGTHTVRWTATDQSGRTSTATQTLNVRAGVQSSNSFVLGDRAQTKVPGGGFAMLGNRGAGPVNVGVQSQTGALSAGGSVTLRDRSTVNGNLRATGDLIRQNLTTVTGSISTHVPSNLPPGMDLAGVVFPPTNAGNVTVPVSGTQTLAPGSYAAVTVFSSGRLTLTAGTYFMNSLDLEPQSRLILDQSAGAVQIFVRNSIIDRGQIAPTAGAPGQFFLGYAGTTAFSIETPFLAGTIVAPNAKVTVTSLGTGAFSGLLFARDIEVQPDAFLTCDPVGRTAQQAGL